MYHSYTNSKTRIFITHNNTPTLDNTAPAPSHVDHAARFLFSLSLVATPEYTKTRARRAEGVEMARFRVEKGEERVESAGTRAGRAEGVKTARFREGRGRKE